MFKHGKIASGPEALRGLLDDFERLEPGVRVVDEELPADTDEQHRFYVINLEGNTTSFAEFDVMALDVIWIPEFAEAGWIRPVDHLLAADDRADFFRGTLDAVTHQGRLHALPWFADAGVLYYRKDLLAEIGVEPPATWTELAQVARAVTERHPEMYGFVFQGKQYEGLVCNALEYVFGAGGHVVEGGRVVLDGPESRLAMETMRSFVVDGISPTFVTTLTEEPTRHIFQRGRAVFMRNWPYALNLLEREGSLVRGVVGVTKVPSFEGHRRGSTLGGWHLAINRRTREPELAERFVRFMTSPEAGKTLALSFGYQPARRSVYDDPRVRAEGGFLGELPEILDEARPRPVTPYYMMISRVLSLEFSAILSGIRTEEHGLDRAARELRHIVERRP